MKFIKIDLLTLLIGLFLLASCKDSSDIGLDLDPGTAIEGKLVDSLTVNSRTVTEEPTPTNLAVRFPLGYMDDIYFGKTDASIALTVNLPSDNYDFGSFPLLDSAVLVLSYSDQLYADTAASEYSIDVRNLSEDISRNDSYLSNRVYATEPTVVGNKTGRIYPTTTTKITDIVIGKPDTLKTVGPQLRIKLDNIFIKDNILSISKTSINSRFVSSFKGFKVSIDKTNSTGNLGFMFFDFASGNSNLELYYTNQNPNTSTLRDTIMVNFPIAPNSSPIAASIVHDYSGTPVQTQLDNPDTQYPVTYLQGLAGVRTKLSFPFLNKFSAEIGKVVVNKAELVVDLSSGTDVYPFAAAPRIGMFRYDIAHQRKDIRDRQIFQGEFNSEIIGDAAFGGYYDPIKKHYVFVVTSYIQDILDGKDQDYGTFISVTPYAEFNYQAPTVSAAGRSVIGSGAKDAAGNLINTNNRVKLNIYYTSVK